MKTTRPSLKDSKKRKGKRLTPLCSKTAGKSNALKHFISDENAKHHTYVLHVNTFTV